jgi:5-methylcytosine-specific restriction endonuclease McrA
VNEPIQAKTCPKCGRVKARADFHKNKRCADGLASWCKECAKASARRWREANAETDAARRRAKYAANPEPVRQRSREWARRNKAEALAAKRAYYEANQSRLAEAQRARVAADPAKHAAIARAARAKKPDYYRAMAARNAARRRARLAAAPTVSFTTEQLQLRIAYFGGRCWICSAPYQAVDHVKPLFAGGWHLLANLRPICTPCNSRKAGRWPLT